MKIHDIITKLNTVSALLLGLKEEIQQYKRESIRWSISDFKQQANNSENPEYYDLSKFPSALELMIEEHDADVGINWDTIQSYLDDYCLKDK